MFGVVLRPTDCADKAATPPPGRAVPILVSQVRRESIPIEPHVIGTGQAFKTVSVESQVAGIIKAVYYRPRQYVRTGDLLVAPDDRPLLAALAQARATLDRDKAQLNKAELARYKQTFHAGIAHHEQYDQFLATAASSKAYSTKNL